MMGEGRGVYKKPGIQLPLTCYSLVLAGWPDEILKSAVKEDVRGKNGDVQYKSGKQNTENEWVQAEAEGRRPRKRSRMKLDIQI